MKINTFAAFHINLLDSTTFTYTDTIHITLMLYIILLELIYYLNDVQNSSDQTQPSLTKSFSFVVILHITFPFVLPNHKHPSFLFAVTVFITRVLPNHYTKLPLTNTCNYIQPGQDESSRRLATAESALSEQKALCEQSNLKCQQLESQITELVEGSGG